ncbi:tetratricopeptide repeat protein [Candidatus Palauibacter soopunensis]|uniref:tetratricopeptide repeat protein n=1 Tax=Candidatus Palauibacter soopunensis TaxID=3056739 RepID=UPI002393F823|nr:tetratricopeptide repeat protein [Candidatus Palauibacter soopunensis]MDE2878743.1 tetratricopeptide repeat protein [Candidatus Palauibacter soopunensis]
MRSTRNILPWVAAGVAVLSLPAAPRALEAQTSDLTILVAPVAATEPVDRRFGERIAEEIRDGLKIFPGYIAIERDDARDLIDDYDLDERTMTAIDWRQLGLQMEAALVMVGTAVATGGGVEVDVNFIEPRSGDELPMTAFTVADDDSHEEAGAQIMGQLGRGVEYLRSLAFCGDYLASEQPMEAISNCNAALALNPDSDRAHYLRGRAHMLNEAWGDAATDLQGVVDNNASDTEALESLAFTYAQLGDGAASLRYYQRYLDFRPDEVDIRLRIAYDLTQAGSWAETVQLLQDGVERAPDNVDLLEYLTGAALQAGQTDGAVTDAAMIRVAVDASGKLVDLQGDAVNPSTLSNATNAYMLLEEYDAALAFSDQALESISSSDGSGEGEMSREELLAQVHSSRATIYDRMENPEMGVAELEQALAYNPDVPNGRQRLAALKLQTGDVEGAVADFRAAVENGADPNQIANAIFSLAYTNHFEAQSRALSNPATIDVREVATALELFAVAAEFVQDPAASEQMHFFIAFGYYLQGSAYDSRNEDDEACAPARSALNAFQRVSTHLAQAGSHQAGSQQQIREAIDVQLYRQESIIEASCSR